MYTETMKKDKHMYSGREKERERINERNHGREKGKYTA